MTRRGIQGVGALPSSSSLPSSPPGFISSTQKRADITVDLFPRSTGERATRPPRALVVKCIARAPYFRRNIFDFRGATCRRGVNIHLIARARAKVDVERFPPTSPCGLRFPVHIYARARTRGPLSLSALTSKSTSTLHGGSRGLPHDAAVVSLYTIYNVYRELGTGPIHGELNFPNFDRASSTARCNLYRPCPASPIPPSREHTHGGLPSRPSPPHTAP